MKTNTEHEGRCFCGKVRFEVSGEPAAMGYCHCASCREWAAAPVTAFTLWPPAAITFTRGAEHIASYEKTERSVRKWCKICGGHILTEHPHFGLVDVYPSTITSLAFDPMLHVNYGETVLHLHDGLPKQHDYPADMGGSGTIVRE